MQHAQDVQIRLLVDRQQHGPDGLGGGNLLVDPPERDWDARHQQRHRCPHQRRAPHWRHRQPAAGKEEAQEEDQLPAKRIEKPGELLPGLALQLQPAEPGGEIEDRGEHKWQHGMQPTQRHHGRDQRQDDEIHRQDVEIGRQPAECRHAQHGPRRIGQQRAELGRERLGRAGQPVDPGRQRDAGHEQPHMRPVDLPAAEGDARRAKCQAARLEHAAERQRARHARAEHEQLGARREPEAGRDPEHPGVVGHMRDEDDQHCQPAKQVEALIARPLGRTAHQNAPS